MFGLTIAKLEGYAVIGALALAVVMGGFAYVHHLQAEVTSAHSAQAAAEGNAAVSQGQAVAASDAAQIVDHGTAKADVTLHIQQENHDAILAAPGASQPVDPALSATLVRSLCAYDAYAGDPGCSAMRAPDSGQLPPTDQGGAASRPDSG